MSAPKPHDPHAAPADPQEVRAGVDKLLEQADGSPPEQEAELLEQAHDILHQALQH